MNSQSLFVPVSVLFSAFNNLDLTLLDCSISTRVCGRNVYKLNFYVENHESTYPRFQTKYINTRTEKKDYSFMVGKNLQKTIYILICRKKKRFCFFFLKKNYKKEK